MIANVVDKVLVTLYGFSEYLLVINPSPDVYDRVVEEKSVFYDSYQTIIAKVTKPHITIANFLGREAMEETLCTYIQRVCDLQQRFKVGLKNFNGFPSSTIYINVQNPQPFKQLANGLEPVRRYVRAKSYPVKLVKTPHMTIARRLDESVYYKAVSEYRQRSFNASFMATDLVLLRRWSQYHTCETVATFPLSSNQLDLFN